MANTGKGAALSLQSEKSPSLAVSNSALVARINADQVDGKNATDLQTRATTWTIPAGTPALHAQGLAPGTYLATVDVALGDMQTSQCELDARHASATFFGARRPLLRGQRFGVLTAAAGDTCSSLLRDE